MDLAFSTGIAYFAPEHEVETVMESKFTKLLYLSTLADSTLYFYSTPFPGQILRSTTLTVKATNYFKDYSFKNL